jgi:hypothetical protein
VDRVLNYNHQIVRFAVYRAPYHLNGNGARRSFVIASDVENHGRNTFQATADIAVIEVELRDWTPEVIQRCDGIEMDTTWS